MLWVLWDIVLPLIGTFLLGLITGWLMWRWRRSRIDVDGLSELRRSSARYRADAEQLRQSNNQLSDRLQAASSAGGGDLAHAKKRINMLGDELKASRHEVAQLKTAAKAGNRAPVTPAPTPPVNTVSKAEVANLRAELEARDRMIGTLKQSISQFGEQGDSTALLADVALRDRKIDALEKLLEGVQSKKF